MTRVFAYDLLRLSIGPLFLTPRGIDRVDLALAKHLFDADDSPNLGIVPTPWGIRALPARTVRRMLTRLQSLWSETVDGVADPRLIDLINEMHAPPTPQRMPHVPVPLATSKKLRRMLDLFDATGVSWGGPAAHAVPPGAVYLNIGQLGLAVPALHNWLDKRHDLTRAIMLHDIIPIEYPQFVSAAAVNHHARMVRTTARHASCLIFNSASARDSVLPALEQHGCRELPALVRWLPLPSAFEQPHSSLPDLDELNYFIVVSSLEPRKNHALLFRVWQRLIARGAAAAPHLVVVGAYGYNSAVVMAQLGEDALLRGHVHFVSGLSSPALAALTLGATAMLSPSFVEGFGLPVLEANALGVPTIASDIAAHREISDGDTLLLPVDDDGAWEQAIAAAPPAGRRVRREMPFRLTETAYCADIVDFLLETAARR